MSAELVRALADRDELLAVLRDIAMGADMMLQVPGNTAFDRYAREVKRVAQAGIDGVRS
jgi:hypothetical protein